MRILLVSFYFPPDIGPGPLRASSIVRALRDAAPGPLAIDVVTTMPNRYQAIAREAPEDERQGDVRIRRVRLPAHRSGMVDQSKAFAAFATGVWRATRGERYNVVVATSSRLMTQVLAATVARRASAKLFLDVRDLFTETIEQVVSGPALRLALPVFRAMERWSYRMASGVNVVSPAFVPHVQALLPGIAPSVFTNGIDDIFTATDFRGAARHAQPLVVYAGNLGEGQGLHHILPQVAAAESGRLRFRVIGDGGRRAALQEAVDRAGARNVEFVDPVPRDQLLAHYREADVLFLHLNDLPAFEKVLPSKVFEYAATAKPMLAGVGGFAASFVRSEVPGAEVFAPCDVGGMRASLDRLLSGPPHIEREAFCARFRRDTVMRGLASAILATARA